MKIAIDVSLQSESESESATFTLTLHTRGHHDIALDSNTWVQTKQWMGLQQNPASFSAGGSRYRSWMDAASSLAQWWPVRLGGGGFDSQLDHNKDCQMFLMASLLGLRCAGLELGG